MLPVIVVVVAALVIAAVFVVIAVAAAALVVLAVVLPLAQPFQVITKCTSLHCYLTLRLRSTDMEEAGFCGRGMIDMVAGLGRGGGGGGGGGGWYHEGWSTETKKAK